MSISSTSDTAWYSHTSSVQTMKTWARVVPTQEDLPQEFQDAFPDYCGTFPYTVLIPVNRYTFLQKRNAQVICLHGERVTLMEYQRDRIKTVSCRLSDITCFVRKKVLLNSRLTFYGASEPLTTAFNTTNEICFEPIVNAVRQAMQKRRGEDLHSTDHQREMAKFDYLKNLNFKYMNYGRRCIWAGDTVLNTLYQPEHCIRAWTFLNKPFMRQYATSHLSILTEHELILIQESKPTRINNSKRLDLKKRIEFLFLREP